MKKLKIGVLGAGAIARASHIPGYAADGRCELAAIADVSPESLAAVREKWRFSREYSDCSELITREKLDLVSICLPNKFHARYAVEALEAGCDVILEKPVAVSLDEALAIREAQQRTGRQVAVCFSHRFNSMVQAAHTALATGAIGKPYMIRIRFAHNGPYPGWAVSDWFYNPEIAGGGAVLDMGIHAIDLARWLIGEVTQVTAFTGTLRKSIAVEDNMTALLRFGRTAMGYLDCGWTSCAGFSGIEVMGDNGAVTVDYAAGETRQATGVARPDGSIEMQNSVIATCGDSAWKCQMAGFIAEKMENRPFSAGIDEGIAALRIALAIYESSQNNRTVLLPPGNN
ncbi:Gfo/Idh/MocA family protein [Victivallis vadensis]|uniref:Gfo/Idh/MocA family protein n=1 Tax=Victivallis vadensis TaxID=172901 RepID=UPI0026DAD675|nr:Gfo/Idh/MocA family oxidoreductase [Victivallis vadensis]